MGGFGSGRRSSRSTVERCLVLDSSRLSREGILREASTRTGSWHWSAGGQTVAQIGYAANASQSSPTLRLSYRACGADTSYAIALQITKPQFGGNRWWFTCPLQRNGSACGRRVRKLFLPPQGRYFGCRHCHKLTYRSRKEDRKTRALTTTQAIRVRLGGSASLFEPFPAKPKKMWNRTYERLRDRADAAEFQSWNLLSEWLNRGQRKRRRKLLPRS